MLTETVTRRLERSPRLDKLGRTIGNLFAKVVRAGRVKDLLSGTPIRHPVHPILTDVTIGAWTSAIVLDIFGVRYGAELLIGIGALSAVPTALTGLNDFTDITESHSRSVGAAHALGNVIALGFFAASYFVRRGDAHTTGVVLSAVGFGVVTAAGFLGGHLSFRRGIGVDQTIFERPLEDWTRVLDADGLEEQQPRRARSEGTDVMLYRVGGKIFALANRCTHRGGPLHKGKIENDCAICPWHLSKFRLDDGEIVRGPATAPARPFDARVHDGKIELRSRDLSSTN